MKIINVVGARANLMTIAPLMEGLRGGPEVEALPVHTGQHYDATMSDLFFRQLGIPEPDLNLGIGSASHADPTAEIMKAFEPILEERRPDAISDRLFCREQSGVDNLRREGIVDAKIHPVGSVMIDTLKRHLERAEKSRVQETLSLEPGGYAILTLHRPFNVDDQVVLTKLLDVLEVVLTDSGGFQEETTILGVPCHTLRECL